MFLKPRHLQISPFLQTPSASTRFFSTGCNAMMPSILIISHGI
jgi:hypothetical protein